MQDLQGPWPETAPICANNGYTYGHIHQVRCLRDFQPGNSTNGLFLFKFFLWQIVLSGIKVLHEGGCSVHEVYRALGRNPHEKACAERRRTFEINPICTVQNKSFSNPFMTICQTSRPTREKIGGTCGSPIQKSCEFAHRIQQSLMSAPASERTRFIVCGSDLRTYRSEHHLECSRRYNQCKMKSEKKNKSTNKSLQLNFVFHFSDLYLTHHGRCENFNNICPEKLKYVNVATPVCGSDKHSYISFDALICARYRMNKSKNWA